MAHDLVIEQARIIDGLGTPAREGSLAVEDGRIAAISGDASGRALGAATQRVDAGGLALAPGIVETRPSASSPATSAATHRDLNVREYASRCRPSGAASQLDPSHRSSWVSPTGA